MHVMETPLTMPLPKSRDIKVMQNGGIVWVSIYFRVRNEMTTLFL